MGRELSPSLVPLRPYLFKTFLAPALKLFEVATELLTPFLIRYIIDEGIAEGNMGLALGLGGVILAFAFLGFGVTLFAQYLSSRVAADYGHALKGAIFRKISSLSEGQLSRFGKDKATTILSSDSFNMQSGVNMFMRLIFRPPFLLIGSFALSFLIDYRAGLIFGAVILLCALIFLLVILVSPRKYASIQANLDEISVHANDSLRGARHIRAFNQEGLEAERFSKSLASYEKKNMDMSVYNALVSPGTFFLVDLGMILVVYLGGAADGGGLLTTGEIVSLISYLTHSLQAMVMFSRLIVSLNKAMSSKKRIDAFLSLKPDIVDGGRKEIPAKSLANLLEFQDVAFSFGEKGDREVISGISFSLKEGGRVGLIGPTGSGKSTLLSLALRLRDPSAGKVLFRGIDERELSLSALHEAEGFVSQKPSLFKGTIRSNVLLGRPGASEEEVIQALKEAEAWEYVSKWDDSLDHPVEEGGANLSGGQRQRLLIARAFLRGSPLLILDDSLSALDYLTERKILDRLKEKGMGLLLVSSRVGSLRDMDEILFLEDGRISARGKHEELLERSEGYREIYEMQKGSVA